jgi:hypothetical protein
MIEFSRVATPTITSSVWHKGACNGPFVDRPDEHNLHVAIAGTATVAEKDVVIARMQADSQAYQARVGLYRGMFWLQVVSLLAYIGPVWHTMLVFLDTCPILPMLTWAHGFHFVHHVIGSWRVPACVY